MFTLDLFATDPQFIFDPEGFELTKLDYRRWQRDEFMIKYIYPVISDEKQNELVLNAKSDRKKSRLAYDAFDFIKCSPIKNVKLTYFCIFFHNNTMTDALARLSTYYEGDGHHRAGTFVNLESDSAHYLGKNLIAGHNMNSTSMRNFFELASAKNEFLNHRERRFKENVFKQLEEHSNGQYYEFITASIQGDHRRTLSHEADHALFGSYPEYRDAVYKFWDEVVTEKDKKGMIEILTDVMHYPKDDVKVLRDEFQAFMLMEGAESLAFYEYIGKYQEKLYKTLLKTGIKPAFRDGPDIPLCEDKMKGFKNKILKMFIR